MKNIFKTFGIIALVAVIGFSMAACDDIIGTKDVPVSGVTLNKSSISLTVGGTETLTATVSPSDATNKAVGWSSSNSNVATVTNGTVTAVSAGSAIITVTTTDGGKTAQCNVTVTGSTTPTTPTTYSLDGVWEFSSMKITVSGSTGVISQMGTMSGNWADAVNKGYVKVGDQYWRNLTNTGNLTWSGQMLKVSYNTSNTNVATGTSWGGNVIFTINTDGQTLTITDSSASLNQTWTRSNYSLDGVWEFSGMKITVSGSTGVISQMGTMSGNWADAVNKGYVKVGDQYWRNLTNTGSLTWSGQMLKVSYNTSNTNVATGTSWGGNVIFTINTDGQTLTITDSSASLNQTWTRKQ